MPKSEYWSPSNIAADITRLLEQDYGEAAVTLASKTRAGAPMVRVALSSVDARPINITITRARR